MHSHDGLAGGFRLSRLRTRPDFVRLFESSQQRHGNAMRLT